MLLSDVSKDPRYNNQLLAGNRVAEYLASYHRELGLALAKVDPEALERTLEVMESVVRENRTIFVCGNGGSAAISEHLACDWMKGTRGVDGRTLKVVSLASNVALSSAIANDYGYEKVFSVQIEMLSRPGDALVLISSSGNSRNIIEAARVAKYKALQTIGLSGFDGGALTREVDISLYVPAQNYGIVEDAHQMIMHSLAQTLLRRFEN